MANKPKILIVEDDNFLERMYASKLSRENLDVLTASDGEKAMGIMSKTVPNLVLLDIIMPKKDGFAVLKEMKADPKLKNVPVVFLTNLGEAEDVNQARNLGASEYLIKAHFLPSEVVTIIRKYIK